MSTDHKHVEDIAVAALVGFLAADQVTASLADRFGGDSEVPMALTPTPDDDESPDDEVDLNDDPDDNEAGSDLADDEPVSGETVEP